MAITAAAKSNVYKSPVGAGLHLEVEVKDAKLRQERPGFDGLEKVFALVPRFDWVTKTTKWERHNLEYKQSADGSDRHSLTMLNNQYDLSLVPKHGIAFGIDTNEGTVWLQAPGQNALPK
jgi:hypothetical protein